MHVPATERAAGTIGAPAAVLAASLLFNLGQGVLRPSLPLYLQQVFGANYRMVTLIPVVFGAGKWLASLPTGYLLSRLGAGRLMGAGLVLIAVCDLTSAVITLFVAFLGVRGVAGMGWAMFGVVATTLMVDRAATRGRAISLLLMSETLGLLLGSLAGGWLYQRVAMASPFVFEAACMLVAAAVVVWRPGAAERRPAGAAVNRLREVVRTPGVLLASLTSAALTAVQTGVLVFLFPLYLAERGGLRPAAVGLVVGLGVVGRLLGLWLAGGVTDGRDRLRALGPGLLGYGAALGSLALVTDPLLLAFWSLSIGAGAGFVAGLPTAIIGDRVEPGLHGIAIGWQRTLTDASMLVGPLVMGALADAAHLSAPFLLGAVLVCAPAPWCLRRAAAA